MHRGGTLTAACRGPVQPSFFLFFSPLSQVLEHVAVLRKAGLADATINSADRSTISSEFTPVLVLLSILPATLSLTTSSGPAAAVHNSHVHSVRGH